MTYCANETKLPEVLTRLRSATGEIHRRIEGRLGILAHLVEQDSRREMVRRFAALHLPAEAALQDFLAAIPDLDFSKRSRAHLLPLFARETPMPSFPLPESRAEALGMFYVVEGSSLGGNVLLRRLADAGVNDPALRFLNPYKAEAGAWWRGFLHVLAREAADERSIGEACHGARRAFQHAEQILCEGMS